LTRLPGLVKNTRKPLIEQKKLFFDESPLSASGISSKEPYEVLKDCGFKVTFCEGENGRRSWLGRKGVIAPFGPHVTHLGILFIFLGGLIGQYYGYEGFGEASKGETFNVYAPEYYRISKKIKDNLYLASFYEDLQKENILLEKDVKDYNRLIAEVDAYDEDLNEMMKDPHFKIKVIDTKETRYGNTMEVKDWTSLLEVIYKDQVQLSQEIEVNTPLSFRGVNLYQHSFSSSAREVFSGKIVLKKGQAYADPLDKSIAFDVIDFYPEFGMAKGVDGKTVAFSKSKELKNPAMKVKYGDSSADMKHDYIFMGQESSIHDDGMRPWFVRFKDAVKTNDEFELHCELYKREAKPVTGVSIQYDPGTDFVWIGCTLMMIGMGLSFFMERKQIWILSESKSGPINVAGVATKFPALFKDEFDSVCKNLGILKEEDVK
jgi:cytochrome c biogenesis protein